jgi:hypothetical protein
MANPLPDDNPEPAFDGAAHARLIHPEDRHGRPWLAEKATRWRERPVKLPNLPEAVTALAGREDVYLSQSRFHGRRRIATLRELSACFVDLDFHKTAWAGRPPEAVAWAVLRTCDEKAIPEPWLIATGRGLLALWPHDAVPRQALPRWQAVQRHLVDALQGFGADPLARDAARVCRLCGTVNSKSGEPVRLVHEPRTWRWGFDDLATEVLPLERGELHSLQAERARRRAAGRASGAPNRSLNAATLWETRLSDLQRLRSHRFFASMLPPGQRDAWLFLAGVSMSWLCPPAVLRREMYALAHEAGSWPGEETEARLQAVFDRAHRAAQGETVEFQGRRVDPRYRFRSDTIIEWLRIEPDEMRAGGLRDLVTDDVRRERERERKARRSDSIRRAIYEGQARERAERAHVLRAAGHSWAEVAHELGLRSADAARKLAGRFRG